MDETSAVEGAVEGGVCCAPLGEHAKRQKLREIVVRAGYACMMGIRYVLIDTFQVELHANHY